MDGNILVVRVFVLVLSCLVLSSFVFVCFVSTNSTRDCKLCCYVNCTSSAELYVRVCTGPTLQNNPSVVNKYISANLESTIYHPSTINQSIHSTFIMIDIPKK